MFSFVTSPPSYVIEEWSGSITHSGGSTVHNFNPTLHAVLHTLVPPKREDQTLLVHHSYYIMCHCSLRDTGVIEVHGKDVTEFVEEAAAREFNKNVVTKKQFVAHIFHEIRNALDVVSLSVDELRDGSATKHTPALKRMDDHIQLIVDIMDDVVTFDNFISLPSSLRLKVFMLDDLFKNCVYMMHTYINTRTLLFTHHNAVPHVAVRGDYMKLKQVILHLLANSTNYTQGDGEVKMRIEAHESSFVRIEIRGGRGSNVDGSFAERDVTGSMAHAMAAHASGVAGKHTRGLALTIVKQIVELHGGAFGYETGNETEGLIFHFTVPIHATQEQADEVVPVRAIPEPKLQTTPQVKTVRVLVVDDNMVVLKLMRNMLTRLSIEELSVASDGQEAINYYAAALHRGAPFTHVLMDQEMPHVDGNAATRAIVDMHPDANVIGVTGNCSEQQRAAFLAHGARQVVNKPVSKGVLLSLLL